jgi:hypothetical protein
LRLLGVDVGDVLAGVHRVHVAALRRRCAALLAQTVPDAVDVFIQGIEQEFTIDGKLLTWFTVAPADTSAALVFDDPDFGKFDERVFAYG